MIALFVADANLCVWSPATVDPTLTIIVEFFFSNPSATALTYVCAFEFVTQSAVALTNK